MELLEREEYLAHLTAWFSGVAEHGGCIVLVRGEAGVGKTVLLQEFSRRQQTMRLLWGACDALFTPRPLGPLHDIARQPQGALLAAVNSSASREEIFSAVLDELEREKSLVVFEDMHWADEASLDLLKYLGRRIHRTHSMLAVTYRDDEVGPRHPLRSVIGDLPRAHTHRMLLLPLSEAAVTQLATQAGRPANGLYRATGGNPLFVTEVLAAVADTVPATVRDAVLARAVRLSAAAREIAELVCVVPGKTEPWLLDQAGMLDEAGIESCLSIGMLRDEQGSLAFRHELARRALEDSLPRARRQTLHSRVLSILALRSDVSAARLSHHADGARHAREVLRYAPLAAQQAASVGAHREAASHYQTALRYAENLCVEKRAQLQEQLSYECHLTGQIDRAIEMQCLALEFWRGSGQRAREGNSLRSLSVLNWYMGRRAEAHTFAGDAVTTLESVPPGPELAMAYCNRACLDMESHEAESAMKWAQRAIGLAESREDSGILGEALMLLGTVRLIGGDAVGWTDLQQSLELALSGDVPERVARCYTNLGAMAVSGRQYRRASEYFGEGLAYCEKYDMDSCWTYMVAYRARLRFEQGEWRGAGEDLETVLLHPGTASVSRIPALRILGHLRIRRGDPDADSPLEEARVLAGPNPELQRLGTLAAVRAEAAWLAGDLDGVIREAQPAYELVCQRKDPRMKGELAAWLWRAGALRQQPTDIAEPYAQEISGDWRGAAQSWRTLGCPYEYASILAWYGAQKEQLEALAILEQLEAKAAALVLRKRMRAQGVRSIPRGARVSTRCHPHGLTRREAQTLALMSDGLRNSIIAKQLFVSTKTVDHHVSAILAKLDVASRVEAIALIRRRNDEAARSTRA